MILRMVLIVVVIVLLAGSLIVMALAVNHHRQLRIEAEAYPPPGTVVEVNEEQIHVYAEGDGGVTLVFMAGHGTSNPTLDFKPLWMRMKDEYRVAVVERSGYGWSKTSSSPRDIDTILQATRGALELAGENGPYVLFPHSMSGLEALRWAQLYPHEVMAIVGLDPTVPESIELVPAEQKLQLGFMYLVARLGLSRFMPESEVGEYLPLMESHELSEEDRKEYLAIFYRSAFSRDMLREVRFLRSNARTVAVSQTPTNTPMLFFISNDQESNVPGWNEALSTYLSTVDSGQSMQLDTGHYVHYDRADVIAEVARSFIEEMR